MAQISQLILSKPHHRKNCRELYAYSVKLEKGKRKTANGKNRNK